MRDNGIEPNIIEYLKNIPTTDELKNLSVKLEKHPKDFVRKGEADFKENGIAGLLDNDEALIHSMAQFPKIIERPIVVTGDKAVIGRPPENVLDLL